MAEGKTVVSPLPGPNYCTWKIQCKMSLMRDGLCEQTNAEESATLNATERRTERAGTRQKHD